MKVLILCWIVSLLLFGTVVEARDLFLFTLLLIQLLSLLDTPNLRLLILLISDHLTALLIVLLLSFNRHQLILPLRLLSTVSIRLAIFLERQILLFFVLILTNFFIIIF